ncbi:NTF2-like N-terminal transpeptidase domain-containing protein [Streptomyces kaempferi]
MNRAAKTVVASAVTALLVTGGVGAYNILYKLTSVGDDGTGPAFDPAAVSKTPPSGDEAEKRAKAFLGGWSQQHLAAAAGDTDDSTSAVLALKDYASGLHLKKLSFTHIRSSGPSTVTEGAAKVDFDVTAQVDGGTWNYASAIAVRQSSNSATAVHWNNSVLYPGLQNDQSLTAGQLPPERRRDRSRQRRQDRPVRLPLPSGHRRHHPRERPRQARHPRHRCRRGRPWRRGRVDGRGVPQRRDPAHQDHHRRTPTADRRTRGQGRPPAEQARWRRRP